MDFHVFEAASGGSGHPVQRLGQSVCAFDPPAVAAVEVGFGVTPSQSLAPGAKHVDIVFCDMDAACGPAIRDATGAPRAGLAGRLDPRGTIGLTWYPSAGS